MSKSDYQQQNKRVGVNRAGVSQRKVGHVLADNRNIAQRQANNTGLPSDLKSGMENLSGMSLDHVRVHHNSSKPAAVQAHAYAQGNNIHLASGQEKHLPHELGHVVQQMQGRVAATTSVGGMAVNDNAGLESEATKMGEVALQRAGVQKTRPDPITPQNVVQLGRKEDEENESGVVKYTIKVVLPGSGDDDWRTNQARPVKKGIRVDDLSNIEAPTTHVKKKNEKFTWTVSGPGGPLTKGGSVLGGASDTGSNSIANNKTIVPRYILENIEVYEQQSVLAAKPILILIKAHSRNAVAGTQIANMVRSATRHKHNIKIELVAFDPVPGPDHEGRDVAVDISSIPSSTVVYSMATQYPVGFTPQKVFGAKRIIISRQNHSVGLIAGFRYGGKVYKGSQLNSLPTGIFIDSNKTGENIHSLSKIDNIEDANHNLKNEFENSESTSRDYGRLGIIAKVLNEYFKRNRPIRIQGRTKRVVNPKTGSSYTKSKDD